MQKVYLVGNPNAGKSTIFNKLTKGNAHTGNWHGVTVTGESKHVKFKNREYLIVDLPGINGMVPFSPEEKVSTQAIINNPNAVFVNVIDINNLARSLNLTLQLLELNLKVIVLFNFAETVKKQKISINKEKFEKILKINAEFVYLRDKNLKNRIFDLVDRAQFSSVDYANKLIFNNDNLSRYEIILARQNLSENNALNKKYSLNFGLEKITEIRQNFISQIIKNSEYSTKNKEYGSNKLDKILLNKFTAIPLFFAVMLLIFAVTFGKIGDFLSNGVSFFVELCGDGLIKLLNILNAPKFILDFFDVAIIGGLGSILSFLPQVLLLFLALDILEQVGFLSRIAWLLDPVLSKLGLSGKSIFPLLMGFGCTTTALPTTTALQNKQVRTKTALILPFMSCSAKLPVFSAISGAFFGNGNIFVIFGLYLLGIFLAFILAFITQKILPTKFNDDILEFTPLRLPRISVLLKNSFNKIMQFINKIWSIILIFTIIIWFLDNFTIKFEFITTETQTSILQSIASLLLPIFAPLGFDWGAVIALLVGIVAKEMVLSSIAVLNGVTEANVANSLLDINSVVHFSTASCLAFLVFCLIYTPCISALAQLKHLVPKKTFWLYLITQLALAYFVSLVVYIIAGIITGVSFSIAVWALALAFIIAICVFFALKHFFLNKKGCVGCNFCNKS